ncbi:MAG: hypothetical protein Fur005_24310 [Roseiflexaceae bacterium]
MEASGISTALMRTRSTTLIITGDVIMHQTLRSCLDLASGRMLVAADTQIGRALVRDLLPNIIIVDLSLPDSDGLRLCEELYRDPVTAHIPLLLVSRQDAAADSIPQVIASGGLNLWILPTQQEALIAAITCILRYQAQIQHAQALQPVLAPDPQAVALVSPRPDRQNRQIHAYRQLLVAIAYELNSPLQTMQNLLFLASQSREPKRNQFLAAVSNDIQRIGSFFQQLIDAQQIDFQPMPMPEFTHIVADTCTRCQHLFAQRAIHVQATFAADLPQIRYSADLLSTILQNAILSIGEMLNHHGRLVVHTSLHHQPHDHPLACLTITAHGTIITDAPMMPFGLQSTGVMLGLIMMRHVVEELGGVLTIQRGDRSDLVCAIFLPIDVDAIVVAG